jgi:Zn-finger nucleic acid-binding protein
MHSYERTHVLVDQCEECRGIFLDHGELERLIEAEGGGWSGRVEAPAPADGRERSDRERTLRDLFGDRGR